MGTMSQNAFIPAREVWNTPPPHRADTRRARRTMRPACLKALVARAPRTVALVTTALWLLGGSLVFYLAQDLSAIDALCLPLPIELAAVSLH